MATPSRPPVTMEWNTEPSAARSDATRNGPSSTKSEEVMIMPDGSVMTMSPGMAMSGMNGAAAMGTAVAGLNFTGAAEELNTRRGEIITGAELMVILGTGSVLLNLGF